MTQKSAQKGGHIFSVMLRPPPYSYSLKESDRTIRLSPYPTVDLRQTPLFSCLQSSPFLSPCLSLAHSLSISLSHQKKKKQQNITENMLKSPVELPDCCYANQPILICPSTPTPKHSLYLSNLDDQKFLRFSIKYLYLFKKSVSSDNLKYSLSRVLVDYYPLAGRLRATAEDEQKFEVDCNGEGAVFAEAFMDITAEDFLQLSNKPNRFWRKLLYRVEALTFLDVPPLVVQVLFLFLCYANVSFVFFAFPYSISLHFFLVCGVLKIQAQKEAPLINLLI